MAAKDDAKLAKSIEYLTISMKLTGKVKPEQIFDASYLPPQEERMLP